MIIEPRQAEPGALRRWSRLALYLIARGFSFWLGLVLLACLWMFAGQRLPLIDGMLALAMFFASILIAARLDRPERTSLSDVLKMLRAHAFEILVFATIIAVAGALIWIFLLARPEMPWYAVFYTRHASVEALSDNWFVALRQIFVYAAYALGLLYFGLNIPGLTSFFQFPCTTLLGLPFRDAYRLGAMGQVRNLPAVLAVGLMFILLPVLSVLLLPILVPLLYCFLGAVTYVGFREIFLGIRDNRLVERGGEAVTAPSP